MLSQPDRMHRCAQRRAGDALGALRFASENAVENGVARAEAEVAPLVTWVKAIGLP